MRIATKRAAGALVCVVLLTCIGTAAGGRTIWAYYDCAPGVTTVVVLSNASEFVDDEGVTVRLYDADGSLLLESVHGLAEYQSTAVHLNDLLEGADGSAWGLAEIESRLLIQVSVWIGTEEGWLFVENYGELAGSTEGLSVDAYWYGASYANTANRRTTIVVLNPGDRIALGDLYLYDASGALQYARKLQVVARRSTYVDLESVFPVGDDAWGLVDVSTNLPVLLVCSYFDDEGYLIDVDVVDQPYYLQADAEN